MKINPDPDMPLPLYRALVDSNNKYKDDLSSFLKDKMSHGDGSFHFSVTTLPKPPRQIQLLYRFNDELEYEPLDFYFSLKGSIIHYIIENYCPSHWLTEVRMEIYRLINGKKVMIHGQLDAYDPDTQTLWDWKFVTGASVMYDKPEHKIQLNVLALILQENGYPVKRLCNNYMIERLDPRYANTEGYPKKEYKVQEHEFMPRSEVEAYLFNRASAHIAAKSLKSKELPRCTDHERWIRSNEFLVYKRKKGTKKQPVQDWSSRSSGSFISKGDADKFIAESGFTEEVKIVMRKGYPKACDYCKAVPFCNQRQKELAKESNSFE